MNKDNLTLYIVFSQDVINGRFYDLRAHFDKEKATNDAQNNRVGKLPNHYTGMFEALISKHEIHAYVADALGRKKNEENR